MLAEISKPQKKISLHSNHNFAVVASIAIGTTLVFSAQSGDEPQLERRVKEVQPLPEIRGSDLDLIRQNQETRRKRMKRMNKQPYNYENLFILNNDDHEFERIVPGPYFQTSS